VFILKTVNPY